MPPYNTTTPISETELTPTVPAEPQGEAPVSVMDSESAHVPPEASAGSGTVADMPVVTDTAIHETIVNQASADMPEIIFENSAHKVPQNNEEIPPVIYTPIPVSEAVPQVLETPTAQIPINEPLTVVEQEQAKPAPAENSVQTNSTLAPSVTSRREEP